jgi:hypothetical protein
MLEAAGALWTWALPDAPVRGVPQNCERLPDHRLAYLDFQGEISGDRGTVTRWDRGEYECLSSADALLEIRLAGDRLQTVARLTRLGAKSQRWVLDLPPG